MGEVWSGCGLAEVWSVNCTLVRPTAPRVVEWGCGKGREWVCCGWQVRMHCTKCVIRRSPQESLHMGVLDVSGSVRALVERRLQWSCGVWSGCGVEYGLYC